MKTHAKLAALAAAFLVCNAATAQTYPTKPIWWVVGFAPGGGNDILARVIAPRLAERLGQQVLVDNRAGADGRVAAEYVAKAAPDGYTIMSGASGQMVYNMGLYKDVPYDPIKSFAPITMIGYTQLLFAVNPSSPAHTLKDFIALAKKKPGALFYGSAGSPHIIAFSQFAKESGIKLENVPYKGDAPANSAVMSNEVTVAATGLGNALPLLKAGKMRALGTTGATRSQFAPDIPTIKEQGVDFESVAWTGVYAPAGTPQPILDRLYTVLAGILKEPATNERILGTGYETNMNGIKPAEFAAWHKGQLAKWTKVMKDIGIKPQ